MWLICWQGTKHSTFWDFFSYTINLIKVFNHHLRLCSVPACVLLLICSVLGRHATNYCVLTMYALAFSVPHRYATTLSVLVMYAVICSVPNRHASSYSSSFCRVYGRENVSHLKKLFRAHLWRQSGSSLSKNGRSCKGCTNCSSPPSFMQENISCWVFLESWRSEEPGRWIKLGAEVVLQKILGVKCLQKSTVLPILSWDKSSCEHLRTGLSQPSGSIWNILRCLCGPAMPFDAVLS